MSTLYHLGSGLIYDCILGSDKGERICLLSHMERLSPGDVLVLDRGYFSYLILVKAIEKGTHLVCRMQSGTVNKAVQEFWDSDKQDEMITYVPSIAIHRDNRENQLINGKAVTELRSNMLNRMPLLWRNHQKC